MPEKESFQDPSSDDRAQAKASSGVQLGEYIIEEKLGSGGMGQVYKARQPSLDRMVALKVLPRSVAADKDAVDRFYREAKSAARLVHPNIVQIYSVGQDRGVPYFAMEHVVGADLERRLKKGDKFTLKEVIGIVASVAMGLGCAEEHGIVHRDIKPGNIMIDDHGQVKVMDFGLAKAGQMVETEITQAGFIVGTPTYMSPEQAESMPVDIRSDFYSLGTVFYELLAGKPPFHSDDPAALIYMHVHREPDSLRAVRPEITPELEAVCLKCLAKRPDDRFQTSKALLEALMEAERGLPSEFAEDAGTIVYDMRMASMLLDPAAPPSAVAAGGPGRSWLLQALALGVFLLTASVALAYFLTRDMSPEEIRSALVEPSSSPEIEESAQSGMLPLSGLRPVLPQGALVEVSAGDRPARRIPREALADREVPTGTVRLTVSRPYYRPIERSFAVRSDGVNPAFDPSEFAMVPDTEFAAAMDRAKQALADGDLALAARAVEEIARIDETSEAVRAIAEDLRAATEGQRQDWAAELERAAKLRRDGDLDAAQELLEKMLAEVSPTHEIFDGVQSEVVRLRDMRNKVREGGVRVLRLLREGRLEESRAAADGLIKDHGIPAELLGDTPQLLGTAEKLSHEAEVAMAQSDYPVAWARLNKLVEIATESERHLRLLEQVGSILERSRLADRLVGEIEKQLEDRDYTGAARTLAELERIDAANSRLPDLSGRVRRGDAEMQIGRLLSHLDSGLRSGQSETVAAMIDADSRQFALGLAARVSEMNAAGVRFVRSDFAVRDIDLLHAGDLERASASVRWSFELDVPGARSRLSGEQSLRVFLTRRPLGWRITAVETTDKSRMLADGAGVSADARRIQGLVDSVDATVIKIDRGSKHGVELKMIFSIYRDGRVVRLPLVDDAKRSIAVVEQELVCRARVVEVRDEESLLSMLENAAVAPGQIAVFEPLRSVEAIVPEIVSFTASTPRAELGRAVELNAEVRNTDGLPCYYLFEASAGLVSPSRSETPQAVWISPGTGNDCKITITVVSPAGQRKRTLTVAADKPSALGFKPGEPEPLAMSAPFAAVGDIAFDEQGSAYLLDDRTRSLMAMTPNLELISTGKPYRGRPARIAARLGHVYLLDTGSRDVRRFPAGDDPLAAQQATVYGAQGAGNGKLRDPVDFAVTPSGEVAILDAGSLTVQVFAADGRFLQSLGTADTGIGGLQRPVGIVADARGVLYALDAERRKVLVFKRGRFEGEFAIGDDKSDLADIAYDAVGNRLLVLERKTGQVEAFTTGGLAFSVPVVPAATDEGALGGLQGASRIVCDGASRLYAVTGARADTLERFDIPTELSQSAAHSGRLSAQAQPAFGRLAAASDGSLRLLDASNGQLVRMTRGGWLTMTVGGRRAVSPWSRAADVACDSEGVSFVLDTSLGSVHRLPLDGERSRFGKRGDAGKEPGQLSNPIALAVRGDTIAVLLRERRYAVHVFGADGTPRAHFPAEADQMQNATAIAISANGEIHAASSGAIETFSADGSPLRRAKVELDAVGLAASPDGMLCALDARRRKVFGFDPADGRTAMTIDLPRDIRTPSHIAVDGQGGVYVLDGRTGAVFFWRRTLQDGQ